MSWRKYLEILLKSVGDLVSPSIFLFLFSTSGLAFILWGLIAWFSWGWWIESLSLAIESPHWFASGLRQVLTWTEIPTGSFVGIFAGTMVVLVLFPVVVVSALFFGSIFSMPFIVKKVHRESYPGVERLNPAGSWAALSVTIRGAFIFLTVWILILPLWLFPPLGPIVSLVLSSWLQFKVLSFEAMSDFASKDEIMNIQRQGKKYFWISGLLVSLIWYIPLVQFLAPIWSSLLISRTSFELLNQARFLSDKVNE